MIAFIAMTAAMKFVLALAVTPQSVMSAKLLTGSKRCKSSSNRYFIADLSPRQNEAQYIVCTSR